MHYDIRPTILRGDPDKHLLELYHDSMATAVHECDLAFPVGLLLVTSKSPKPYKKAVEKIATFFQREMGFDFPQYQAFEYSHSHRFPRTVMTDADLRSFLWYDTDKFNRGLNQWPSIGACSFRFKRFKDCEAWVIDWVWIHPYERRHGHLTKTWPFFKAMFGEFGITNPVSPSMRAFWEKMQRLNQVPRR
jgi:hypothetical protein